MCRPECRPNPTSSGDTLAGAKYSAMPLLLLRIGRVDQPHQQEEGHHRRHEVGIGDLPRAAVVAAADHLLDLLDDDRAVAQTDMGGMP